MAKKRVITKADAARRYAKRHYEIDSDLVVIVRLLGPAETDTDTQPIKFLEVNKDVDAIGIMPLGFDPMPERGIPFDIVIVQVTPGEYAKIRSGRMKLPNGWVLGEELLKPAVTTPTK